MDYETVSAAEFGKSLRGIGLNFLVRDVQKTADFLQDVFDAGVHQMTADFAIVTYGTDVFQLR